MRYLTGRPFTVPVGNGKLTDTQWERAVGAPQKGTKAVVPVEKRAKHGRPLPAEEESDLEQARR
jgi:hypothetical protein